MANVCVFGAGRVGLPLALVLARSHDVAIVERDPKIAKAVRSGKMPFHEPGFDAEIAKKMLFVANVDPLVDDICISHDHTVVCIGTPLMNHMEPDVGNLFKFVRKWAQQARDGQHISLRSTVAPGICDAIIEIVRAERPTWTLGVDFYFTHAPERISEGLAHSELLTLPQIVGAYDENSRAKAHDLYSHASQFVDCDVLEAELCKVFCNARRYVEFALGNQLAMTAMEHNRDPHRLMELASAGYPRFKPIKPGYAAGTCLRKDFGFLSWKHSEVDIFTSAWRINEHLPVFIVNHMKQLGVIKTGSRVLLLGATFKMDCDDMRDSLGAKLRRQLLLNLCHVDVHDPMVKESTLLDHDTHEEFTNLTSAEACASHYDVVVIGSPHTEIVEFVRALDFECWVSDIWGAVGACKGPLYRNTL